MKTAHIGDMKGGWFVGDFEPSVFKTNTFEVGMNVHLKGSKWDMHYHKQAKEINLLLEGRMKIQDKIIEAGTIFVLEPYEIADPEFLEDCRVVVIKTPSIPGDKFVVEPK